MRKVDRQIIKPFLLRENNSTDEKLLFSFKLLNEKKFVKRSENKTTREDSVDEASLDSVQPEVKPNNSRLANRRSTMFHDILQDALDTNKSKLNRRVKLFVSFRTLIKNLNKYF